MLNKLVSIVIPTYNRYEELIRAVESSINQTYKNIEIIVIDDNVKNLKLRKRIKIYLDSLNANIKFIENKCQLGGALSRNVGIKESQGEYIAFLDDDDENIPTRIQKQLDFFENSNDPSLALVYSYGTIIYPNNICYKELTNVKGTPLKFQMCHNIAGTSFWLCKKSILEKIGGFERIYSHQDGLVILKLLGAGYKVDLVEDYLINYYAHDVNQGITGVTEKSLNADEEYFNYCKKYFSQLNKNDRISVEKHYYYTRIHRLILLKKKEAIKNDLLNINKNPNFSRLMVLKCLSLYFLSPYLRWQEKRQHEKLFKK